jgi:polyisoprenoid-binding protein YceI
MLCACAICLAAPARSLAADEPGAASTQALDPARSGADFEVKVLWLIGVHGRFGKVHGTVTVDRVQASAVADARIDVDTITMRNHTYEDWVKSDEFFDVRKYPQIRFVSDPVPIDRFRDGGAITGTLSVRGIDRKVTFELAPSACPEAVASACPVEANGSIQRSDFGMKSRRGTLSDKVDLGFSIYVDTAISGQGQAQ